MTSPHTVNGEIISQLSEQIQAMTAESGTLPSYKKALTAHEVPHPSITSSIAPSSIATSSSSLLPIISAHKSLLALPSPVDGKQPIIHNKLYCDQVRLRKTLQHQHQAGSTTSAVSANCNNFNTNTNNNPSSTHVSAHGVGSVSSTSSSSVLLKLKHNDLLKSVKSHTELAETANGVRMLARNLARATIQLDVRAIMVVTKARDNSLIYLTREVAEWLLTIDRDIVVFVDGKLKKLKRFDAAGLLEAIPKAKHFLKYWDKSYALRNPENIDLVVTLGGDGTVLYVSNLFQRVVPPVMSFSLGSLGFLTNFEFDHFREKMSQAVELGVRAYLRMRFTCRVHKANGKLVCEQQVLNELVVDRGPSPYVTQLELYGDGSLLTVAQADGLIIATPTGSTAYSLSAGGSLVHPGVSAISVTPICPHTLSFRPILLPDGMLLKVKVPKTSRSTAWASFDGKVRTELGKGDYVTIQASPFPFPTVILSKTDYIDSVSRNLHWNVRDQQKPFASLKQQEQLARAVAKASAKAAAKAAKAEAKAETRATGTLPRATDDIGDFDGQLHIDDALEHRETAFRLDDDVCDNLECAEVCSDGSECDGDEDDEDVAEDEDEEFDIDEGDYEDTDEEHIELLNSGNSTNTASSVSSDEDEMAFLPESGTGLSTPPRHGPNYNFEERTCFAHPNARITLRDFQFQ